MTMQEKHDFRESIKSLFRNNRCMTAKVCRQLEKLGFTIEKGRKHFKLYYGADRNHPYIVSSTPSDYRSGLNTALLLASAVS